MDKVLSGNRPTGKLHIGHLFGILYNWRDLQDKYECYYMVADWHALTTQWQDTSKIRENIVDMVIDWLSVGIDPEKAVLFVQSEVKEHAELHMVFSMLVTISRLLRNPTFKEYVADLRVKKETPRKNILKMAVKNTVDVFIESVAKKLNTGEAKLELDFMAYLRSELQKTFLEYLREAIQSEEDELPYGSLVNYGFLGYPVLQAADILVYKAKYVPIGADQLPHLELSREIARKFNSLYGQVFPIPEPLIAEIPKVPGLDGRKMSKSYGNAIEIAEPPDSIRKKISRMFTDPLKVRKGDPGHPENCPVFTLHKLFNRDEIAGIKTDCEKGLLGCVECKKRLAEKMITYLEPYQQKRHEFEKNRDTVVDILKEGAKKAIRVAEQTMDDVREAMKLWK